MEKFSKFKGCKRLNVTAFELTFSIPIRREEVEISKADPFQFWNASASKTCPFTYDGPEFVIFNASAYCLTNLSKSDINQEMLRGVACNRRQKLNPNLTTWLTTDCQGPAESPENKRITKIKHHGAYHSINCQNNKINTNHKELSCPQFVFSLPETESFNMGDYFYSHQSTHLTLEATLMTTAPDRINLQLSITGLKFAEEVAEEQAEQIRRPDAKSSD